MTIYTKLFTPLAATEPIIDHLKSDYRMARNYLKGAIDDRINLLMAASETLAAGHFFGSFSRGENCKFIGFFDRDLNYKGMHFDR